VSRGTAARRRGLQPTVLSVSRAFDFDNVPAMFEPWTARGSPRIAPRRSGGAWACPRCCFGRRSRAARWTDCTSASSIPIGPYILDFYCDAAKLAVEVDGATHGTEDRPERDDRRDAWLAAQGIATLRLPASLVLRDVDAAVRTIVGHLQLGD